MKLFSRLLSLLLCLLLLGGSVLAADSGTDTLPDRITEFWDTLDLPDMPDLSSLTEGVRALAEESAQLDDEALGDQIRALAEDQGIPLNDAQIRQLLQLIRSLETGIERGAAAKNKLEALRAWFTGTLQTLRDFFQQVADVFRRVGEWIGKLL